MICKKQPKGADDLGRNLYTIVVQLHIYIYSQEWCEEADHAKKPHDEDKGFNHVTRSLVPLPPPQLGSAVLGPLSHHIQSWTICTSVTQSSPVKKARDFVGL